MSNRMDNNNDHSRGRKIFVGGLFPELTEIEFKNYFEKFGRVTDVVVMHDNVTNRPRGFGFITFESAESVDSVLRSNFHELNGKHVEVKRAIPKKENGNGNISNARGGRSLVPNSNVPPPSYPYNGSVYPAFAPYPPYQPNQPNQPYGQGVNFYGLNNIYGNSFPSSFGNTPSGGALYSPNLAGMFPPPHTNSLMNPTYPSKGLADTVAMNRVADTRSVEINPTPTTYEKRKLSADAVPFQIKDRA